MDPGPDPSRVQPSPPAPPDCAPGRTDGADADVEELLRALTRALRALGSAGEPDAASRIAALAWSGIRRSRPEVAERLNGTMHYLARLPDPVNAPHQHAQREAAG